MTPLKSGDVCRIVDHPQWTSPASLKAFIGITVVLLDISTIHEDLSSFWSPYWKVSGKPAAMPPDTVISHRILEKIDPPPQQMEFKDTDYPTHDDKADHIKEALKYKIVKEEVEIIR